MHENLFNSQLIMFSGLQYPIDFEIAMCLNRNATFFSQGVNLKLQKVVGGMLEQQMRKAPKKSFR